MRRILTIVPTLLLLVAAVPATAQPPWRDDPRRRDDPWGDRIPNLNGTWFNSGDEDQPCFVRQRPDGRTLFTNEKGDTAPGVVRGDRVIIPDWGSEEGLPGLVGRVRGDRIIWPDGNFWSREPR